MTFTELGDPYWTGFAQLILAGIEHRAGDTDQAERWVRVSLASARDHGLLNLAASGLYSMAAGALVRGDAPRALRLVGASEAIRERIGDAPAPEMALTGDVRGAAAEGMDPEAADRLYDEGRAMEQADAIAYALKPAR